jgi:tRNA nucleotidyltransferase/poly(A) polymerase
VFPILDAKRDGDAVGGFSSIGRPLQDFDVVIDGTPEQAAAIETPAPYRRANGDRV